MVDPEPETATRVVQQMTNAATGGGNNSVSAETVHPDKNGQVAPNQEAPRSDSGTATTDAAAGSQPAVADPNELKPNIEPDQGALPPLQQSNQLDNNGSSSSASTAGVPPKSEELADISSSKKKKKKGISKLNPF
jgi:hypothetical protein